MDMQQRSPEWFEARKTRVTGSVVGAILGLSPYMSRADAMRNMVREALGAPREFTGNVATEYGTHHEAGALLEFQMETGLGVAPASFVTFDDWLGASPDGYVGDDALIEVKCPYGLRNETDPMFKGVADQPHYHAQMQIQLLVTGRERCHFFQWSPHGTRHDIVPIDRQWLDVNIPRLRQFHAKFLAELRECPDEHLAPKRLEIDTPEAHRMVAEWDALNEALELAAERKKDLLESMVALAGERNALIAGRKLTMTERAGTVSYAKALKALVPDADLEPWRGKPTSYWGLR